MRARVREFAGRFGAAVAAILLPVALIPPGVATAAPHAAAALPSNPVDYAYDSAGQLRGVSQAGGSAARYDYDDSGNVTAVTKYTTATVSVLALVPATGAPGSTVTISGTGFAATTTGNTVKFNGTAATVTAAGATRLTVTVPSGATTGTVTVTTSAGTGTSATPFTLTTALGAPTITKFTPAVVEAGDLVAISGTGFDPTIANDDVVFGHTRAHVESATSTLIKADVVAATPSGPISVTTPAGTATSSTDLVVAPPPYDAPATVANAAVAVDGSPVTVTIPTGAVGIALLRFAAVKGQRLSLALTGNTINDTVDVLPYSPTGQGYTRQLFDSPWTLSPKGQGVLGLVDVPSDGEYQVALHPENSGTGSITVSLTTRLAASVTIGGAASSVTFTKTGQEADVSLTARTGVITSVGFTGSTFASGALRAKILGPHGETVPWGDDAANLDWSAVDLSRAGSLVFVAPENGTYRIVLGSTDGGAGAVTMTASEAAVAPTLTVGRNTTVTASRSGQEIYVPFAETTGQKISVDFTSYGLTAAPHVTIVRSDGSFIAETTTSLYHVEPAAALPATDTYYLILDLGSSTGSVALQVSEIQTVGTLAPGSPQSFTMSKAGQSVQYSFSGTAGAELYFGYTNWTFPTTAGLQIRILDASGTVLTSGRIGQFYESFFTPSTTGTYRIELAPDDGTTGGLTVTLSNEVAGGALAIGTAKTISVTQPGQGVRFTFTGAVGQRLSLGFPNDTLTHAGSVQVLKPDGTVLLSTALSSSEYDLAPLTVAGTYQVLFVPYSETGSTQLMLIERLVGSMLTTTGAGIAVSITQTGRYAELPLTATAGEQLSFGFTSETFGATGTLRLRVIDATGTPVSDQNVALSTSTVDSSANVTITTAGAYRVIVGSATFGPGNVTVTASDQINGGAVTLNTAKALTIDRPGRSARLTYAGTAGQNLSLAYSSVTLPFYPATQVYAPGATTPIVNTNTATVSIPTLPSTGTYTIVVIPFSATGAATVTLATRAATASAAPRAASSGGAPGPMATVNPKHATVPAFGTGALKSQPKPHAAGTGQGNATWTPQQRNLDGTDWATDRPPTPAAQPATRKAGPGRTALSGRVLTLDGKPLPSVTVSVDTVKTETDSSGQFLLDPLPAGHRVLRVDGASASTPGRTFGRHDIGVDVAAGQTTVLPYTIWLSQLDTKHEVSFASPTTKETVITTPAIPGLQVRLPEGAVVRDVNGKVVTKLGITAIPVDRPPFPLPQSQVPVYFTVQPGSSYVFPAGAEVIYPNFTHAVRGATMDFWHYDPAGKGWYVYGHGQVTVDGKSVVPDAKTRVYQFTGAMLITPGVDAPPSVAPAPGDTVTGADPVDLGTGLLLDQHTDMTVDDTIPLSIHRTYQQADTGHRTFGIGMSWDYDLRVYSTQQYYTASVVLPDGGQVTYHRVTSDPANFRDASFAADPTPSRFAGSTLTWNGDGWDLLLTDGTTYVIGNEAPLQGIRDKFGNTVTITRAPAPADANGVHDKGPVTQITSPNGRWIQFTYDSSNRVTSATDNIGRTVTYAYDTTGHLHTVTDADKGVTTYNYDSNGRLWTITDAKNTTYLTNTYDANGRVQTQTLADGTSQYKFAYTTGANGKVTATQLTDPNGNVRRAAFNSAGYETSDTQAYGTADAQTTTITRDPTTNLPTDTVDALGRHTTTTYDTLGYPTAITEMVGASDQRTTSITYGGPFHQVSQIKDPDLHATNYGYKANGALQTMTDAVNRVTTFTTNAAGQPTAITDNNLKTTSLAYDVGVPISVTDPVGYTTRRVIDPSGQVIATIDPQGATTRIGYDGLGNITSVVDPLGRTTALTYDANGNLHTVTDPRKGVTTYDYDSSDRVQTLTDPDLRKTVYAYDGDGNPLTVTDARNKVTKYTYDDLSRPTLIQYGYTATSSESQTAYTYDAGNRVRAIVDSTGGTTTFTPDDFDRPTSVVSPQGTIGYAYDAADRRTSMTVAGQSAVTYGYNDADDLTSEQQGSTAVSIGYDPDGREKTLTLPSGTQTYTYDDAGRPTAIAYTSGSTTLGSLSYTYDGSDHPIHEDGTFARATVPASFGPATYDAADQLKTVGSTSYAYDNDGDLTSDGTTAYGWNARGQLTSLSRTGLSMTFGYDAVGSRSSRTSSGATTGFLSDGLNPVQELSGSAPSANMLTGGVDQTFVRSNSSGSQSLLTDALGSTIATAGGSGTIAGEYTYGPFGASSLSGTDAGNAAQFTGRTNDPSGLYYYRNRYYDPGTGRFLSPDPTGQAGGINPYEYAADQPTDLTDPLGLKPEGSGGSAQSCTINSFTPDTPVLMADGSAEPIGEIQLGDQVMAGDPQTGESRPRPVTALIHGSGDKELVDISLHGAQPSKAVTATANHPFWVDSDGDPSTPGGEWVNAGDLRRGQWLKSSDGHLVRIAGTKAHNALSNADNLTVDDLHTYYVLIGHTPVLVHNEDVVDLPCGTSASDAASWVDEGAFQNAAQQRPSTQQGWFRYQSAAAGARSNALTGRSLVPEYSAPGPDGETITAKFDSAFGDEAIDRKLRLTKFGRDEAERHSLVAAHNGVKAVYELPSQARVDEAQALLDEWGVSGIEVRIGGW